MFMVLFCLRFVKMVGKTIMGEGTFINGEEGLAFTPLQTMKELNAFWLHSTA